jgi:hypothetical protein
MRQFEMHHSNGRIIINHNSLIINVLNVMKKILLILFCMADFLALKAQDVLLFDFDNTAPGILGMYTWPWTSWDGLIINDDKDDDGTGAVDDPGVPGNKVAKIAYNSTGGDYPGFILPLSATYNSSNFAGFTVKMKSADAQGLIFTYTIEDANGVKKGNWATFPGYTSGGAYQTLKFPFLAEQKGFVFDRICLNFVSHTTLSACTVYIDDVTLVRDFTSALAHTQFENTTLSCTNGVLNIDNLSGKAGVKIYTADGVLLYSTEASDALSVNLKEKGIAGGVLLVALDNGNAGIVKKVVLK